MVEAFVTAEESTNPIPGVWVLLSTWSFRVEDGRIFPIRFEVTTSTNYRAILPACGRVIDGICGTPCIKPRNKKGVHGSQSVDKWLKHIQTYCHDFHLEHAQAFRDRVQETYGKGIAA